MTSLTDAPELASPRTGAPENDDTAAGILAALDTLPLNQREVIRLKFLHGHSYREINELTGLSESNVGFLIHTGLKTLRRRLVGTGLERNHS